MKSHTLKAYVSHLLDKFEQHGPEALRESERAYLAFLFAGDLRKGEFRLGSLPASSEEARHQFCAYARNSFLTGAVNFVMDYREAIASQAAALASERRPLVSLILYATWIEHWVNAAVSTVSIRRGVAPEEAEQVVRDAPLRAKLTWVLQLADSPPSRTSSARRLLR